MTPPVAASPAVPLQTTSPTPPPGDADLKSAAAALSRGDSEAAEARLEAVIALGDRAPGRIEALFTLAVIRARPDSPLRDIGSAQALLWQVLASRPPAPRAAEARLILALLTLEEEKELAILDLRAQIDAVKGEADGLKAALAQREEELRKIKDILLEKQPGP